MSDRSRSSRTCNMLKLLAFVLLPVSAVLHGAPIELSAAQDSSSLTIQGATPGTRLQLFDGTEPIGSVNADSTGKAKFSLSSLVPGNHTIHSVERGSGKSLSALLHVHIPGRQTQGFAAPSTYATGLRPAAMAIRDMDGDGAPDVVVAGPGAVAIMYNKGGTFGSPVKVADMAEPTGALAIDLDGDGRNDLAITGADGTVTILLNQGNGKFSAPKKWTVGSNPSAIRSADFNQDGIPDLAVSSRDGNAVSILLGTGDGSFKPALSVPVGHSPRSLVSADFNGDGIADLATANFGDETVSILLGNGDGTFRNGCALSVNSGPISLQTGDFDEDGAADLAVLTQTGGSPSVLLNDGSGTFRIGRHVSGVAAALSSMVVGDFDGDGHADLLLQAGSEIHLQSGAGNGSFTNHHTDSTIAPGLLLAVADMDGDGRLDVTAIDLSGTLTVLSGVGKSAASVAAESTKSSFMMSSSFAPRFGGSTPSSVALTSSANPASISQYLTLTAIVTPAAATGSVTFYDGEAILGRIALTSGQATLRLPLGFGTHPLQAFYTGSATYASSTSVTLSESVTAVALNGFQAPLSFSTPAAPRSVVTGDFNGDGKTDFVVAVLPGALQMFLNNGAGGFTRSTIGGSIQAMAVATGDFNGDGKTDLAVALYTTAQVAIYLGNGNGTFQTPVSYAVGTNPYHVVVGDLNNDGIADLVLPARGIDSISVLLGKGDGTFQPVVNYPTTGDLPFFASIADFDGDGNADVIVPNNNSASLTLFLGKGDGTFKTPVNIVSHVEPFTTYVADLNGDGKMDFLVTSAHQFSVGVFLGNGDGTFQTPVYYAAGSEPHFIGVSDFNGDGKPDLVISDFEEASVNILLGNGDGTFQPKTTYFITGPNGTPNSMALADFNGDGAVDMVMVDFHGLTVVVREGNTSATNTDVPMPNIVGMTQAQATAALQAVGLTVSTVASTPHSAPAGTVISQLEITEALLPYSPNTGTILPTGTAVQFVLSSGPGTKSVYSVVNQTVAQAAVLLPEDALVLGTVSSAPSSTIQAGNIISQTPDEPATAATGTVVNVVVSTGPSGQVSVPNVAGQTQAVATSSIQSAGLVVGTVTAAASSTVAAGSVISESPAAGTQVNTGTSVNLVVSSGAVQVAVPNVVGQTQAAATSSIQSAGLVVGNVTTASSSTVAAGNVISESPVAGTQVNTGTSVSLVVSSGVAQAPSVSSFTSSAPSVTSGQAVTLSWNASGATSITISPGTAGTGVYTNSSTPTSGSVSFTPPSTGEILFDGDSLTCGEGSTNSACVFFQPGGASACCAYPPDTISALDALGRTILTWSNLGISSTEAQPGQGAATQPQPPCHASTNNPAIVAEWLGSNDLTLGRTPAQVAADLKARWTLLQNAGCKVVAFTILSRTPGEGNAGFFTAAGRASLNSLIQSNAAAMGILVADVAADSRIGCDLCYNDTTYFSTDLTHLNDAGYNIVASIAAPVINSLLNVTYKLTATNSSGSTTAASSVAVFNAGGAPSFDAVPNVVGQTQSAAVAAIQAAGLTAGTVTTASSSTVAAGSVISESPVAGTQAKAASAVTLVVSTGAAGAKVAVPNVVGQTQAAASSSIQSAGLVVGTVTTASSSTVAAGSVISENPVAGTQVNAGSSVSLVVSSGAAQVTVPNVVGQTQAAATSAIQAAGLVVGTVTTASSSTVAAGNVISENPVAGTQVNVGSAVVLVISTGAGSTSTATSVTLASSINPASISQYVTLTATVTPAAATGSVTFYDGASLLGRTVIASGQAQVRMPLGSGAHTLTALYTGSASYTASTSAPLSQVVTSVAENGFQPLKSFAAGAGPRGVAAGDFNGDGKTDFVVAVLPGQLKLFLNNGAGGFTQSSVGASIQASAVATGDFNGDGKLDLAVALFTNSQVGIYLGNGDGTFKTAVNYPVGTNPYHVAVGDFNNDGIADLVLPNKGTNDMSVLLGKGDGTFRAAVEAIRRREVFSIYASIADFDGDGNADIVIPGATRRRA